MTSRRTGKAMVPVAMAATIAAFAAACGPTITVVNPTDSLDYAQSLWKDDAGSPAGGAIVVIVDAPDSVGAAWPVGKPPLSTPLVGLTPGDEKKQVQAMVKQAGKKKSTTGVLITGYADMLVYMLQHHLSQRYGNVTVKKASEAAGVSGIHVSSEVVFFMDKRQSVWNVDVKISGGGATGAGIGDKKFSAAHIGWFLPLLLMTFPAFVGIPLGILDSSLKGTERVSIINAMDAAAEQFAAGLGSDPGGIGSPSIKML